MRLSVSYPHHASCSTILHVFEPMSEFSSTHFGGGQDIVQTRQTRHFTFIPIISFWVLLSQIFFTFYLIFQLPLCSTPHIWILNQPLASEILFMTHPMAYWQRSIANRPPSPVDSPKYVYENSPKTSHKLGLKIAMSIHVVDTVTTKYNSKTTKSPHTDTECYHGSYKINSKSIADKFVKRKLFLHVTPTP